MGEKKTTNQPKIVLENGNRSEQSFYHQDMKR